MSYNYCVIDSTNYRLDSTRIWAIRQGWCKVRRLERPDICLELNALNLYFWLFSDVFENNSKMSYQRYNTWITPTCSLKSFTNLVWSKQEPHSNKEVPASVRQASFYLSWCSHFQPQWLTLKQYQQWKYSALKSHHYGLSRFLRLFSMSRSSFDLSHQKIKLTPNLFCPFNPINHGLKFPVFFKFHDHAHQKKKKTPPLIKPSRLYRLPN